MLKHVETFFSTNQLNQRSVFFSFANILVNRLVSPGVSPCLPSGQQPSSGWSLVLPPTARGRENTCGNTAGWFEFFLVFDLFVVG